MEPPALRKAHRAKRMCDCWERGTSGVLVLGASSDENSVTMALTERDQAIIEFERTWWSEDGSKESIIRERFELSTTRYYELLGELIDSDEAHDFDPLVIRRLRRLRDRRRRARFERQIEQPPAR